MISMSKKALIVDNNYFFVQLDKFLQDHKNLLQISAVAGPGKKATTKKGKSETMEIKVLFLNLSDSEKAYYFTWIEQKKNIYLPKSLVDKMNPKFDSTNDLEIQTIKIPKTIMEDKY